MKFAIFPHLIDQIVVFPKLIDKIRYFSEPDRRNLWFFCAWLTKFVLFPNPSNIIRDFSNPTKNTRNFSASDQRNLQLFRDWSTKYAYNSTPDKRKSRFLTEWRNLYFSRRKLMEFAIFLAIIASLKLSIFLWLANKICDVFVNDRESYQKSKSRKIFFRTWSTKFAILSYLIN